MGLFKKFRDAWFAPMSFDSLDDDFYDRLEESLILADVGMDVALDATEKLRRRAYDDRLLTADQVKGALREILAEKLEVGDSRLDLSTQQKATKPSGKTTGKQAVRRLSGTWYTTMYSCSVASYCIKVRLPKWQRVKVRHWWLPSPYSSTH